LTQSAFILAANAIFDCDLPALRLLVDAGLDVHEPGPFGNTLLRNAATQESPDALRALLDAGADPNHRTFYRSPVDKRFESGFTPLLYARTAEVVSLLLERGADANAASDFGTTALMRAETEQIARLLIERGAAVDSINQDGSTALMLAASGARPDVVRYLLSRGADPNMRQRFRRGKKTHTALSFASAHLASWAKLTPYALAQGGVCAVVERLEQVMDLLRRAGAV
jgi:ankyrin repeat protein